MIKNHQQQLKTSMIKDKLANCMLSFLHCSSKYLFFDICVGGEDSEEVGFSGGSISDGTITALVTLS